jgi:ABC-2 type transport system ATP-binding protein
MVSNILQLDKVLKTYGNYTAVNQISFDMPTGSIFGLLGPNGAGKTSLIRIITTITRADSGTILFDGAPLDSNHPNFIGYMPEERGLYKKMKVGEHLLYLARLKGLSKAEASRELKHWFDKFEIGDWWNKKVEELSKGMQQKIQFIATVLHKPKLLILDEPFSGLDPINSNLIKDEIYQLQQQGTSILFSTHRMEQVEEICQQIVLVNKGSVILDGAVKDIKNRHKKHLFKVDFDGQLPGDMHSRAVVVEQQPGSVTVQLPQGHTANELLSLFIQHGVQIIAFQEILPSLNEIFISRVAASNE